MDEVVDLTVDDSGSTSTPSRNTGNVLSRLQRTANALNSRLSNMRNNHIRGRPPTPSLNGANSRITNDLDQVVLEMGQTFQRRGGSAESTREIIRRPPRRRPIASLTFKLTCLDGPQRTSVHQLPLAALKAVGAGIPDRELGGLTSGGVRVGSKFPKSMSADEFEDHLRETFRCLNGHEWTYHYTLGHSRELNAFTEGTNCPALFRAELDPLQLAKKSRNVSIIYIRPLIELQLPTNASSEDLFQARPAAMTTTDPTNASSEDLFQARPAAMTTTDPTNASSEDLFQARPAAMTTTDENLLVEVDGAMKQLRAERRLMLEPEPAVGIALRFMFPNGLSIHRIFISDVSHQDVYRFVGCQESTPRHFILKYHSSGGIRELDGSGTIDGNLRLFVHPVASARVLRSPPQSTSATFTADHAYAASPFIPSTPLPEDSEIIALPAMESWYEDAGTPEVQIRRQRPLAHGSTLPVSQMENDSTPSSSHTQTRQEVQDRDTTVAVALTEIQSSVLRYGTPTLVNVTRDNVCESAMRAFKRRHFCAMNRVDVSFLDSEGQGEGAMDEGGPLREFFRLLMAELKNSELFTGADNRKVLSLSAKALESRKYEMAGTFIAMSLANSGSSPKFFSPFLFNSIIGLHVSPTLEEVEDEEIKEQIRKVASATSCEEARQAVMEASTTFTLMGCFEHVGSLEGRNALVQRAIHQFTIGRMSEALEQLKCGLQACCVLESMRQYPEVFKDLFVHNGQKLTALQVSNVFEPQFSHTGGNRRREENRLLSYWRDWLLEVEDGDATVSLEEILAFATGASEVPPLGFSTKPILSFRHPEDEASPCIFPRARTCACELSLPMSKDFESFKLVMQEGVAQTSGGFGMA